MFVIVTVDQLAELGSLVEVVGLETDTFPLGAAPFLTITAVTNKVRIHNAPLRTGTPLIANVAVGDTGALLGIIVDVVAIAALALVAVVDHATFAVGSVTFVQLIGPLSPATAIDASAGLLFPRVIESTAANTSLLVDRPFHVV